VGDYQPTDIDLHEGAGVAVQRVADLPKLKLAPFIRRAIESHLLPIIGPGLREGRSLGKTVRLIRLALCPERWHDAIACSLS
jgi:hypothetical protein